MAILMIELTINVKTIDKLGSLMISKRAVGGVFDVSSGERRSRSGANRESMSIAADMKRTNNGIS